jgi:hypothetical protein
MSLKTVTGKICVWCVAVTVAALTLLAVTWTVILVSDTGVLSTIKIMFPG